ncbi:amino acid adenylation domain-containing protein [Streptomyces sp. NPDC020742]|uniref:non-ribosomal peptide synthetase n=1 Tax=Streptomyces sp. NPDC020742 TaxID=3154897 RepID=UPI0033EEFC62
MTGRHTWAQQDMAAAAAQDPGRHVRQDRYLLDGPLDAEAFADAWREVAGHHDVPGIGEVRVDLRDVPQGTQEERLRVVHDLLAEQRARVTEGATGPMAVALVRCGPASHQLCWTYHRMQLDPWSADLLLHRVLSCLAGAPPTEPVSREGYLAWQERQDLQAAGRFWRRRLAGAETPTEVRLASGRATAEGTAAVPLALPAGLAARLTAPEQAGAPAPAVLAEAAWAFLLSLYAQGEDVVFGAVRSGRRPEVPGASAMVGSLAGTVPVRTRVAPDVRLGDWLREFATQRNAERPAPLSYIRQCGASGHPLFDSVVEFVEVPEALFSGPGMPGVSVLASAGTEAGCALSLGLRGGREFRGELRYDPAAVSDEAAGQLARQYVQLLGVLADEGRHAVPLGSLDLLDAAEHEDLVRRFNDTQAPYDRAGTVLHRFTAWVQRQPDAVAVQDGALTLTYAELDERSSALAALLVERGIAAEHTVGTCFERSAALVVAMVAVLKAGGCYLPLDPAYPQSRLRLMMDDTRTRLVLAEPRTAGHLPDTADRSVLVLAPDGTVPGEGTDRPAGAEFEPAGRALPDSSAYLVYTSGSTGTPKGVVVPHAALTWFAGNVGYLRPGPDDVVALASSPSFDALTFECWVALTHGARLVVIPKDVLLSSGALARALRTSGVTVMYMTAALLEQLSLEVPDFAAGLRVLLFGGQQANPEAVARVRDASAPARLMQVYGPTETTVWNAVQVVPDDLSDGVVPLGTPIENSTMYLLDDHLRPVPSGVPGEVFIGGDGVTLGYLGRPGLTATRFLPNPFGPGRLYRTGDLARFRADGSLEFLGRVDDQVKIRGFRIELGEVESALRAHPAVSAALVVAREIAGSGPQLIAYLVPDEGAAPPTPGEVRAFLTDRLPSYMIPSLVIPLQRIPLAPTGKVDRKALPLPLTPNGRLDRRKLAQLSGRLPVTHS